MRLGQCSAAIVIALASSAVAPLAPSCAAALATPSAPDRGYVPLSSGSLVEDKSFYLLTLMERLPAVRAAVALDPALTAVKQRRWAALAAAKADCKGDVACCSRRTFGRTKRSQRQATPWSTA